MKNLLNSVIILLFCMLAFTSCNKDEKTPEPTPVAATPTVTYFTDAFVAQQLTSSNWQLISRYYYSSAGYYNDTNNLHVLSFSNLSSLTWSTTPGDYYDIVMNGKIITNAPYNDTTPDSGNFIDIPVTYISEDGQSMEMDMVDWAGQFDRVTLKYTRIN